MKILVIGSGGREHAVIQKLRENPAVERIYCAPGNGGIAQDAECVPVKATDIDGMVALAQAKAIDLVVVTPDDPLAIGMTDSLRRAGIRAFGPSKRAAEIESSKVFAKQLMRKYGIPTADYAVFSEAEPAIDYVRQMGRLPVVIKADGLALGKGVIIAESMREAEAAIRGMIEGGRFGQAGSRVVIEEFMTGPEVSVLAFTDGKTLSPMVSAMDHKRVFDGDRGPNTGGMGTIAPNPHYTSAIAERCMREIFLPTVEAMRKEGRPFAGCLYFGLMLTPDGPKVVEYNCRFGDPETQVVLPLLKTDLLTIMNAVIDGTLDSLPIEWSDGAAACIVLASGGYPGHYETGFPIEGLEMVRDAAVYHAGTKLVNGHLVTGGGRVLGVTATAPTLEEALDKAYAAAEQIRFDGRHYRRDIGRR